MEEKTLKQRLYDSVNAYIHANGVGIIKSGPEILMMAGLSDKSQSIYLSDYCYNRYNKALKEFEGPFLFEYLDNNYYRILGQNYKYTGDIIHKPQSGPEYVFGRWDNGVKTLYKKPYEINSARKPIIDIGHFNKLAVGFQEYVHAHDNNDVPLNFIDGDGILVKEE